LFLTGIVLITFEYNKPTNWSIKQYEILLPYILKSKKQQKKLTLRIVFKFPPLCIAAKIDFLGYL